MLLNKNQKGHMLTELVIFSALVFIPLFSAVHWFHEAYQRNIRKNLSCRLHAWVHAHEKGQEAKIKKIINDRIFLRSGDKPTITETTIKGGTLEQAFDILSQAISFGTLDPSNYHKISVSVNYPNWSFSGSGSQQSNNSGSSLGTISCYVFDNRVHNKEKIRQLLQGNFLGAIGL